MLLYFLSARPNQVNSLTSKGWVVQATYDVWCGRGAVGRASARPRPPGAAAPAGRVRRGLRVRERVPPRPAAGLRRSSARGAATPPRRGGGAPGTPAAAAGGAGAGGRRGLPPRERCVGACSASLDAWRVLSPQVAAFLCAATRREPAPARMARLSLPRPAAAILDRGGGSGQPVLAGRGTVGLARDGTGRRPVGRPRLPPRGRRQGTDPTRGLRREQAGGKCRARTSRPSRASSSPSGALRLTVLAASLREDRQTVSGTIASGSGTSWASAWPISGDRTGKKIIQGGVQR